jgi:hypothetical protein
MTVVTESMMRKAFKMMVLVAMSTLGFSALGSTNSSYEQENSGFLTDYSQLKAYNSGDDANYMRWVSPKLLDTSKYKKFLLEPVDYYPSLPTSAQVSTQVLAEIKDYYNQSIRKAFGDVLPLTDQPGPDTLRVKMGITAISIDDKKLKPYQLVPVAFLITTAKGGLNDMTLKVMVETEVSDSQTGEVLAGAVKSGEGDTLENDKVQLTLEMIKPLIDGWVKSTKDNLIKNFN